MLGHLRILDNFAIELQNCQECEVFFALSGSQNFLLSEHISQSLAGRTSVQKLLPLSVGELREAGINPASIEEILFKGCFPRLYDRAIEPPDFFPSYVETYVQRDG